MRRLLIPLVVSLCWILLPSSEARADKAELSVKPVAVVAEPKLAAQKLAPEKEELLKRWLSKQITEALKSSSKIEIAKRKGEKKVKPAQYVVLSNLTIFIKARRNRDKPALKPKTPCSISLDMRLVKSSNSQIMAVSSARVEKTKWPGLPSKKEKLDSSKLSKLLTPLIQKASQDMLKSM